MQEIKTITQYRQSLRDRIVDTAMKAFAANGIKAVKMDDIAQMLGISKRTLYEIYENKEVLLFEGVKRYKQKKDLEYDAVLKESNNVMDIILKNYKRKVEEFKNINPAFYSDMGRYPRVLEFLESEHVAGQQRFMAFLERGVNEGYFRSEINPKLVTLLVNAISQHIMSTQLYLQFSMEDIILNHIIIAFRGLCTQQGIEVLDRYLDL